MKPETRELLIAMLESQLKIELIIFINLALKHPMKDYTETKIEAIRHQLKELKGE